MRSRSPSLHREDQQSRYVEVDADGGFMGTCGELGVERDLGREEAI